MISDAKGIYAWCNSHSTFKRDQDRHLLVGCLSLIIRGQLIILCAAVDQKSLILILR